MEFKELPHQTSFYRGKVRDVYYIGENGILLFASDRISAFDVILPKTIPFKGQVLNQIAAYMLDACADICKHWKLSSPTPNSSAGLRCKPFKIEVVVRGTLTGHAWRTYQSGARSLCGVSLPENMKENQYFNAPIITPSSKADIGHDEDITETDILNQGLATKDEWQQIKNYALALFERGKQIADKQGLILADTKYEFGMFGNDIYLMDEIHTPDSSRYFLKNNFEEKVERGEKPVQLSKEFVREWLISNDFMGKEGQTMPELSNDWVNTISKRYIELYEMVTGQNFIPSQLTKDETQQQLNTAASKLYQELG